MTAETVISGVLGASLYGLYMVLLNLIGLIKRAALLRKLAALDSSFDPPLLEWLTARKHPALALLPIWPVELAQYWRDRESAKKLGLL